MSFFLQFSTLNDISLNNEKDAITWSWTSMGEYTAASAYDSSWDRGLPSILSLCCLSGKHGAQMSFLCLASCLGRSIDSR
jgi:hypothetical protein